MGEKWPVKFSRNNATSTSLSGSLTCRKAVTLDRQLYFPSKGLFRLKNLTASAGFVPVTSGTRGQRVNH
jgi:hypothetical protein